MLRKSSQNHALTFSCDGTGAITELMHDSGGFFRDGDGADILNHMQEDARSEFLNFLSDVRNNGHAMRRELILERDGRELSFSLFGILKNGQICIIAVQWSKQIFLIYDEFMAMINEQARALREEQKKNAQARSRVAVEDKGVLDEYMRLNNEMANMQRELSIAHQALQAQEKRFRDLVTFNPDAQVVIDNDGRILFFNPAAERIIGLSDRDSIGSVFALDLRGEKEFCLKSADRRSCVEIRHTDVSWEGQPATLFSLRDITERKQMEQIKEDVGRILQHDLASPLNPIVSLPQLLMDDANITADQKRILGMISKAGMRMLNMIRLSLNLYKMEQGSYDFIPEPVDLASTFRDILADLSERTLARKVYVRIALEQRPAMPRDVFWIHAEPNLCYSMFSNLLLNGIEASPQGGTVTVELSMGERALVAIHNTGAVPTEIRATFFEKYVTRGKPHGTGLGTYSARLIALTLGGDIRMETSDEHGTTVSVELPATRVRQPAASDRLPEPRAEGEQRDLSSGKADYGPNIRALMKDLRREIGLHTYQALPLAGKLQQSFSPGTAERIAFERISGALASFDFPAAAADLDRIMQDAGQGDVHEP